MLVRASQADISPRIRWRKLLRVLVLNFDMSVEKWKEPIGMWIESDRCKPPRGRQKKTRWLSWVSNTTEGFSLIADSRCPRPTISPPNCVIVSRAGSVWTEAPRLTGFASRSLRPFGLTNKAKSQVHQGWDIYSGSSAYGLWGSS